MKKIIVTFVTLASLCQVLSAQTALDAAVKNCYTVSVSAQKTGIESDSATFYACWIEKQISPGIWELYEKKTAKILPIIFDNLSIGKYRVVRTPDNHEDTYYDPRTEMKNDRAASAYFNITDCSANTANAEETLDNAAIQLFPNPASNVLNLVLAQQDIKEDMYLDLLDITGRKMLTVKILSAVQDIDISSLKAGSYTALLYADNTSLFQKLIIVQK